jgi:hypothetical protein
MILEIVDISIDPAKKADFEKAVSNGKMIPRSSVF